MIGQPIRVLIVDDSSLVRATLERGLGAYADIDVVGSAPNPFVARDLIEDLAPQVMVLDIEMPRMDGLTFLRRVMKYSPMPVIVVSSLTERGTRTALACIEAGAVAVLAKPGVAYSIGNLTTELADAVRAAAVARLRPITARSSPLPQTSAMLESTNKIVALGASTGGTQAIERVLRAMPPTCPAIAIVQHMPPGFTQAFAERLRSLSSIDVREARDNDPLQPGCALIAPGNHHMRITRSGATYCVKVLDGPRVCQHRPSVEVLFESAARSVGSNAMGILLTGMGDDGATGLRSMRDAGAFTLAQDEASCVVFGMPKEAIARGGADVIAPLDDVPGWIGRFANGRLAGAHGRDSA